MVKDYGRDPSGMPSNCVSICTFVLVCQYLYFCTRDTDKDDGRDASGLLEQLHQYLYFCTSKASTFVLVKQVNWSKTRAAPGTVLTLLVKKVQILTPAESTASGTARGTVSVFVLLY